MRTCKFSNPLSNFSLLKEPESSTNYNGATDVNLDHSDVDSDTSDVDLDTSNVDLDAEVDVGDEANVLTGDDTLDNDVRNMLDDFELVQSEIFDLDEVIEAMEEVESETVF